MPLRRWFLALACLLVVLPALGRAQTGEESEEEDVRNMRLELNGYGGRGQYTSCNTPYELRYGGGYAAYGYRSPGQVSMRVAGGYATGTERALDRVPAEEERTHYGGGLAQVGYDWEAFGFLVGLGIGRWGDDLVFMVPITLRAGPVLRTDSGFTLLNVRLGFMDDPSVFGHSLLWAEHIWFDSRHLEIYTGAGLGPYGTSGIYMGGEVRAASGLIIGARARLNFADGSGLQNGYQISGTLGFAFGPQT